MLIVIGGEAVKTPKLLPELELLLTSACELSVGVLIMLILLVIVPDKGREGTPVEQVAIPENTVPFFPSIPTGLEATFICICIIADQINSIAT